MSYSRFALFIPLLFVFSGTKAFSGVECPDKLNGHELLTFDVFDGLPYEKASMIPMGGEWNLDFKPYSKEGFYLFCRYADTMDTKTFHLPPGTKKCVAGEHGSTVTCH